MKFFLERNERQQCWRIYDMSDSKPMENPPLLMTISDSLMDKLLEGYCVANGAVQK